jgi:hypothetical protein
MSAPKTYPDRTITLTHAQAIIVLNSLSDTEDGIYSDDVDEDVPEFEQQQLDEIKAITDMF